MQTVTNGMYQLGDVSWVMIECPKLEVTRVSKINAESSNNHLNEGGHWLIELNWGIQWSWRLVQGFVPFNRLISWAKAYHPSWAYIIWPIPLISSLCPSANPIGQSSPVFCYQFISDSGEFIMCSYIIYQTQLVPSALILRRTAASAYCCVFIPFSSSIGAQWYF